jgi:head-tail adaptor
MVLTARLTELLTIQQVTYTGETFADKGEKWIDVKQVYGSIVNQRGSTSFTAPGNVYSDGISFYMRWIEIDQKGTRIKYKDQYYEIVNCTTVQRNQALVIDCVAVQ